MIEASVFKVSIFEVNVFKINIFNNIVISDVVVSGKGFFRIIILKGFLKRDSI